MSTVKASIARDQVLAGILKSIGANEPVGVYYQGYGMKEIIGACDQLDKVAVLARMEYLGQAAEELHDWAREGFPEDRLAFRFNLSEPDSDDLKVELVLCKGHIG